LGWVRRISQGASPALNGTLAHVPLPSVASAVVAELSILAFPAAAMFAVFHFIEAHARKRLGLGALDPTRPLERVLGMLTWLLGGAVVTWGVLGALVTQEPSALLMSDRARVPLRDSVLFELASHRGLLFAPVVVAPAANEPAQRDGGRVVVLADLRNPRIQAALKDPVVLRAIRTGDYRELEQRNRLLRPLEPTLVNRPRHPLVPLGDTGAAWDDDLEQVVPLGQAASQSIDLPR
jgi:hypothetical protein